MIKKKTYKSVGSHFASKLPRVLAAAETKFRLNRFFPIFFRLVRNRDRKRSVDGARRALKKVGTLSLMDHVRATNLVLF